MKWIFFVQKTHFLVVFAKIARLGSRLSKVWSWAAIDPERGGSFWGISSPTLRPSCETLSETEVVSITTGHCVNRCIIIDYGLATWTRDYVTNSLSIECRRSSSNDCGKILAPIFLDTRLVTVRFNESKRVCFDLWKTLSFVKNRKCLVQFSSLHFTKEITYNRFRCDMIWSDFKSMPDNVVLVQRPLFNN